MEVWTAASTHNKMMVYSLDLHLLKSPKLDISVHYMMLSSNDKNSMRVKRILVPSLSWLHTLATEQIIAFCGTLFTTINFEWRLPQKNLKLLIYFLLQVVSGFKF